MTSLNSFERILYINLNEIGGSNKICDTSTYYNQVIIDPSQGHYILSIERLTVPIQKIPCQEDIPANWFKYNNVDTGSAITGIYSLSSFINDLNSYSTQGGTQRFKIRLRADGRVSIKNISAQNIEIKTKIANLLNFQPNVIIAPNAEKLSEAPIFDTFDQLKRIVLTSNTLTTQNELNNSLRVNEITSIDFVPSFSVSATHHSDNSGTNNVDENFTFSYTPRQNLVLEPNYPRFIKLGGVPITQINIRCVAEKLVWVSNLATDDNDDGYWTLKSEIIPLPSGSVFNMKLAFWLKKK